jgi:hypothetical protein
MVLRARAILIACLALDGCTSQPSLEIVNMSGYVQQVLLMSANDVYWIDSVGIGQSRCWKVPQHAEGKRAILSVSIPLDVQRAAMLPWAEDWADSLVLDRGWLVEVHAPRNVEGTAAWNERRRQKELEVAQWFQGATEKAIVPLDQLLKLRTDLLNDSSLRSPGAPHLAPNITMTRQRVCAG